MDQSHKTLLDTSSDEEADVAEAPQAMDAAFADAIKATMNDKKAQPSKIPHTQVFAKGRLDVLDLVEEIEAYDKGPQASHQLPKGKLKLAQQNKTDQLSMRGQKVNRPNTLELLQGLAETTQQREAREKHERQELLRIEKEKILAKRAQIQQSKIGKGMQGPKIPGPAGASTSPMRKPTISVVSDPTPAMFGGKNPASKTGLRSPLRKPNIFKTAQTVRPSLASTSPLKPPTRIPGLSPSKGSQSGIKRVGTGTMKSPSKSTLSAEPQKMFSRTVTSRSATGASKIGKGARSAVSPMKKPAATADKEEDDKDGLMFMSTAHFYPTISPVKETEEDEKEPEVKKVERKPNHLATEASTPQTNQTPQMKRQTSAQRTEAFVEDLYKMEQELNAEHEAVLSARGGEEGPMHDDSNRADESTPSLQPFQFDQKSEPGDDDHFKSLLDETPDSGLRLLTENPEVSASAGPIPDERTRLEQSSDVNVVNQITMESLNINVDLLSLVKNIRRCTKADLHDKIQKELDDIDKAIETNEELPKRLLDFDDNFDVKRYRPGVLTEWDFEFKKLSANEAINVPDLDLEQLYTPFTADHKKIDASSLPMDESQADRLRLELEKVQTETDRMKAADEKSNSSDDLLSGQVEMTESLIKSDEIIGSAFVDGDSTSFALPRPIEPPAQSQQEDSSLQFDLRTQDERRNDELELMSDAETRLKLQQDKLAKIAQLHAGELDTLTEHPDQEDLMSQIDAIEHTSARETIMVQKRPSRREQREEFDMIAQINKKEKMDRKKLGQMRVAQSAVLQFPGGSTAGQRTTTHRPSIDGGRPEVQAGFEPLSSQNLKKPRSMSHRAKKDDDIFDSESDCFSAFQQSESSINIGSRDNSPEGGAARVKDVDEKDLGAIDVNLMPFSSPNKDFERLVQEARAEKEKANKPSLLIDTSQIEEENKLGESQRTRHQSGLDFDLPKPLPKPQSKEEEEKQRKELRGLVTYKEHDENPETDVFMDTVPQHSRSSISSSALEPSINMNSLLSLLITDSSLKKARTAHLYICEDRELSKSSAGLKILYEQLVKQNEEQAGAFVLLKIAKVFFCLNKISSACETISKAVADMSIGGIQPASEALFWKGLIYFYAIFQKRVAKGSRKISPSKQEQIHQDLSQMINSCEAALIRVQTDARLKIVAKFTYLKLSLFVARERFGCDLTYITQIDPIKIANSIQSDDYYYGQIAMAEVYIDGQERKPSKAFQVLNGVIQQYPTRGEAYIKLWQLNMFLGNELKRSQSAQQIEDQRTASMATSMIDLSTSQRFSRALPQQEDGFVEVHEDGSFSETSSIVEMSRSESSANLNNEAQAKKYYAEAYEVVSRLLQNCDENFASTPQQRLLLVFLSVKSLQKSGQYIQAFELLQREFAENPAITSMMYLYGKYVVKAMASEVHEQLSQMAAAIQGDFGGFSPTKKKKGKGGKDFRIDQGYLGSGIGALEECLRSCFTERHAKVNYYIGWAYKVLRMPLKTQEYWVKAQALNKVERVLSTHQASQVKMFLDEQAFFNMISENADRMIQEKQGLVRPPKNRQTEQARRDMIKEYMRSMQNMEKIDVANSQLFCARMEAYLIETADTEGNFGEAFDRLIQQFPTFIDGYIHFWNYLKFRLTSLSKTGAKAKHAGQITDNSGLKLLDKMRECATNALMYADATEVPTSLWVEARIIYAKQMIFEKEIGKAISILKDICYIIPPYDIPGLSYVQKAEAVDNSDLLENTVTNFDEMSAEEIFMRQSDKYKARQSPTRKRINKDAPMFQKKTFKQVMFDSNNQPRSQQVLPKGRLDLQLIEASSKGSFQSGVPQSQQYKKGVFEITPLVEGAEGGRVNSEEGSDMFDQMRSAEKDYRETGYTKRGPPKQLDVIEEETKSEARQSSRITRSDRSPKPKEKKNELINDAFSMLDKIAQLSRQDKTRSRQGSMMVSLGGGLNNRMSMYRKQPQQRGSQAFGAQASQTPRQGHNRNRSLTIYNPFNFDQKMVKENNLRASQQRITSLHSRVSQSVDFQTKAPTSGTGTGTGAGSGMPDQKLELAYQAMLSAQMAWQEQNDALGEINEAASSNWDEEGSGFQQSESRVDAIIESENFAIYSNFKFLQLIGKYCAKSKQYSDEGLKALNDYLLLLEYHRSSYTKQEYYKERAITIFYIGSIFYHMKDYFHAVEHLLPIQEQLHAGRYYKELAISERKVSKIWRLNFNERTINWNYFSLANQDNFQYLDQQRQANLTLIKMSREAHHKKNKDKKIHSVFH